eukprot:CAMPEP_0195029942 /NCGR_PEP_ID=MMETSP0326_2-20130528/57847_1 /TAXON_ID=2866 ORGANISM="Crypthecodinium cohnii, Strain Seligo" /NCGR_SAMPLE_ID=MMETSP0326_2 /ASSEMBLY_ACC=CAM_ASM_000348 /LENGTH=86 /DNA_ID=CAMNT_0040053053 /DNA_START=111 /DNA_END=371 /DNA_ORIENTATION=+
MRRQPLAHKRLRLEQAGGGDIKAQALLTLRLAVRCVLSLLLFDGLCLAIHQLRGALVLHHHFVARLKLRQTRWIVDHDVERRLDVK